MKKQCINVVAIIAVVFIIGILLGNIIVANIQDNKISIEFTTQTEPMMYLKQPPAIKNFLCEGATVTSGDKLLEFTTNEETTFFQEENIDEPIFVPTTKEEVVIETTTKKEVVEDEITTEELTTEEISITEDETCSEETITESEETTVVKPIINADSYRCSLDDIYYTLPIREYTEEQKELIAKMLYCEANTTSWDCQVAVCSAIINLIEDRGGNFAILDNANAFTPASYYRYETPSESSWQVLDYVLSGHLIANIKYFQLYSYHNFGTPMFMIDGVYFSR